MTARPMICALFVALIAASGVQAQALRLDGLYKPRGPEFAGWDCTSVGADGGAIEIRNLELQGVESFCRMTNPVRVTGMDALLFDMECAGEGAEWDERAMFLAADFGLYYIENGFVAEWERCEP